MAERNSSEGFSKSRPVLGDLTNRLGKRDFYGREKRGIESFSSNDIAKRTRDSSSPRPEINSLKGNFALSIAKVPNGNREPNLPDLGSGFVVSNRSIYVETDCNEGKNALTGNSEVHDGNKDIKILDLGEGIDVFKSVTELDDGNDLVDGCGEIGLFKGDKVASLNCKGPNLTNLEEGRALISVATEAVCCRKLDLLKENEILGIAEIVSEPKFANPIRTVIGNVIDIDEANEELGDSFLAATSGTVSETGGDRLNESKGFDSDESKASLGGTQSDIKDNQNNEYDHNADNLVLSQCGSIDCMILPESQESRIFGVERSTERKKGDECDNISGGTDSIKACTCSFCTKAAHIWLDLNYQDIKARVSAMKNSQKEASILADRSIRSKVIDKNGAENFSKVSKLESDLMHQWRSLFQHTADVWEEEGNQLEARLPPLADLIEKSKTDLESINATVSENH